LSVNSLAYSAKSSQASAATSSLVAMEAQPP
jgi:hypothetical protein